MDKNRAMNLNIIKAAGYELRPNCDEGTSIYHEDGTKLDFKSYKDGNKMVYEYTDKKRGAIITIRSDGNVELQVNEDLKVIAKYNDNGIPAHIFRIEVDLFNDNQFPHDYKTIEISVCRSGPDDTPGHIILRHNDYDHGSIFQAATCYYVNGAYCPVSGCTTDNYMKEIELLLSDIRGWNWCTNIKEGFRIVTPALRICIDEMLAFWQDNLDDYLTGLVNARTVKEREKKEIQEKIVYYNKEIRILKKLIEARNEKTRQEEVNTK